MISREIELACNYRKCRQPLVETAIVTICQHIFCLSHGPGLETGQHRTNCPACNSPLDRNANDFIEVDLQPSDRFKSLILAGQSPEIILDITRRAITFYELQQSLRSQFLEYVAAKSIEKTRSIEKELKSLMLKMKEENSVYEHMKKALTQECEELRSKLIASDQKLSHLERECQKLRISARNINNSSSSEAQPLNRSFANPNNVVKNSWKPDLKRTHREIRASPDSLSDYSPLRSAMRLHQDGQLFDQSFIPDRGSPFRFVPVNSINPDAEKGNPSKAFQFPFGN
ncbi:E3 ubiquitin-protein ligase CCNB1IP1 [Echinococcus granulosus]|uniref:E3 ubiquitin-protein ligase CCNB1IP1 n=2 Tax=Echinococcus granulosus TaxID=6210 RepID=W6UTS4_ECHGR|nr:E3 ubiquitin-protein ligase CCNB1IP1 [Echinococcus granulosus]EUB65025.1 E3 ubiquitin-protein ligase CCNB1IP1 [Echinococcus granulosus]